jgi:hypothetical protein
MDGPYYALGSYHSLSYIAITERILTVGTLQESETIIGFGCLILELIRSCLTVCHTFASSFMTRTGPRFARGPVQFMLLALSDYFWFGRVLLD